MTITQERFLEQFALRLVDKGFIRVNFRRAVVLEKRMTISESWPVVKVQIRIGSILLPYDVTVGLLMDYKGGPDEIIAQIVRKTTEGFADIIIKQL